MEYSYSGSTAADTDYDDTGGDDDTQLNLKLEPYTYISFIPDKAFGYEYHSGDQTFALTATDVQLHDGVLYRDVDDPDGENHKVFSWPSVMGRGPNEIDIDPESDPNPFMQKTYGSTEKEYEFVDARVGPDENPAEPIELGEMIMWLGTTDNKPKAVSKTLAQLLTSAGTGMVVDGDTTDNWLANTNPSENLLRDDLADRRLMLHIEKRDSNESDRQFHHPILTDMSTGEQIVVETGDTEAEPAIAATDGGAAVAGSSGSDGFSDAVQDFLNAARTVTDTEGDARELLDDIVSDASMDLTEAAVDDAGGRDALMAELGY